MLAEQEQHWGDLGEPNGPELESLTPESDSAPEWKTKNRVRESRRANQ